MMFPVVNFLKIRCYRSRLVFNCCFETIDISLGSVATHLMCSGNFSDSIINYTFSPDYDSEIILKIG